MLRFNKANREQWETSGQQYTATDEQGRHYTLAHSLLYNKWALTVEDTLELSTRDFEFKLKRDALVLAREYARSGMAGAQQMYQDFFAEQSEPTTENTSNTSSPSLDQEVRVEI